MLAKIALYLVDVVAGFFVYVLLARFHFQWLRVPFRNPVGEFVIAVTNWMVAPARRVVPAVAGFDLASLLLALLVEASGHWAKLAIRGFDPDPASLAMVSALELLRCSFHILVFALILQAVISWTNPHNPLTPVFDALTRPFLRPIRRFLPPMGGIDLSPLVLLVLLQVLFFPLDELRKMVGGAGL